MGKITSIYLTDKEASELKRFCDENQCTQYSALKTALRELTSKPMKEAEESSLIAPERETIQKVSESDEATEKDKQTNETKDPLLQFLERLKRPTT